MTVMTIIRKNIMQYSNIIGEDLAEHIVMSIAEDLDDMEEERKFKAKTNMASVYGKAALEEGRRIMNNKYYIVMCDTVIPVQAPDGGIWADHEEAEYSGVIHTKRKDAEDEMKQARKVTKKYCNVGSFWIKELEN